jgi:two-component system, NarL family, response regulator NreC
MTRIVLADDHNVVRQGLRAVLDAEYDLTIVGEADNGFDAIKLVERLLPDVLIIDVMMPGITGLEVARQIREQGSATRVIMLSMYANEAYVIEALRYGASAYVLKHSDASELIQAVQEVRLGRRYLGSPLSQRAIEEYLAQARETPSDPYDTLTQREREVLQLAAQGYANAEIAEYLMIGARTVETHRANMMQKLELQTQTELVKYAVRRGIISLDQ